MGDKEQDQALRSSDAESGGKPSSPGGGKEGSGGNDIWPRTGESRGAAGIGTGSADDTGGLTAAAPRDARDGQGEDSADPAGSGGLDGPDAGSPGGMGGARVAGGTGTDRPPGGLSPVQRGEGES